MTLNSKIVLISILAFILAYSATSFITIHNSITNCHRIEFLNKQIRETIVRGNKTLPTLGYYKAHPAELRNALRQNEIALEKFQPIQCRGIFN